MIYLPFKRKVGPMLNARRLEAWLKMTILVFSTLRILTHWLHGATAERLTPDQKVGSSNLCGYFLWGLCLLRAVTVIAMFVKKGGRWAHQRTRANLEKAGSLCQATTLLEARMSPRGKVPGVNLAAR